MPPSRVRIPPSPLRLTERCPSGLRSATGNRVRAERCVEGSNPSLSASYDHCVIARLGPVVLALLAAAAFAASAHASGRDLPTDSTPLAISYRGSFELTNTMVPQGVQHSYVYHVEWIYSWSGTWGELFPQGSGYPSVMSFQHVAIAGNTHALWRNTTNGPDIKCTLGLVRDKT